MNAWPLTPVQISAVTEGGIPYSKDAYTASHTLLKVAATKDYETYIIFSLVTLGILLFAAWIIRLKF